MLTRNDRTVEDADCLVDQVFELGVRHIGFKDVGVPANAMRPLADRIRERGGVCYLEVVSTTPEAIVRSLETAAALGVDRILGGTDLRAAQRILGDLSRYFPFPGRPVGHPTRLEGSAELVAEHCSRARAMGCGGVDLLAYRATQAEPLDLVRAARNALSGGKLIVAGSVHSAPSRSMRSAESGVDAFTIGSAVFDGSFSPAKGSLRGQILDILEACDPGGMAPPESLRVSLRRQTTHLVSCCAVNGRIRTAGGRSACRCSPLRSSAAWLARRRTWSQRCGLVRASRSSAIRRRTSFWGNASSAHLPCWPPSMSSYSTGNHTRMPRRSRLCEAPPRKRTR